MIYPECLQKGDTIGVTAPSSGAIHHPVDTIILENAARNLTQEGYHVIETANVRQNQKLVSSSSEERAKEFYELYCNPDVKHIIAATGGEFLMDMLPYLENYSFENKKPKWVQGFSDTSLLLYYLTTKYQIATVHATNYGGYGRKEIHPSFLNTLKMISDARDTIQESYQAYEATPINWQEGKEQELPQLDTKVEYHNLYGDIPVTMQGRLIGGCIDVLKTIIGTPFDYTKQFCEHYQEGMMWYLENCEMSVCDLYRALWQMKMAGWFQNCNGFLIGRTRSKEAVQGYTYEEALHDALDSLQVPVIYDVDVGHTQLQWTMFNGSDAIFSYEKGKGRIVQMWK